MVQWQVYATTQRPGGTAVVVLGADDRGGDIMDVVAARLPAGEWDVTAETIASGNERRLAIKYGHAEPGS
jgi:hypothetical protein